MNEEDFKSYYPWMSLDRMQDEVLIKQIHILEELAPQLDDMMPMGSGKIRP